MFIGRPGLRSLREAAMHGIKWPIVFIGVLILIVVSRSYPMVSAQSRTLYGYVYSTSTGKPIDATVTVNQCSYEQTVDTSVSGSWQIQYPYGTLGTVTFSAAGYASQTFQLDLNAQWYYSGGIVSLQPI